MQLGSSGKYVSAKTCKTGDILVFKNAGMLRDSRFLNPEKKMDGSPHPMAGKPKKELVFDVVVNGNQMQFTCNATNRAILIDAYGSDTDKWVGKKCSIVVGKTNVGGQLKDTIQLAPSKSVEGETPIDEVTWEE